MNKLNKIVFSLLFPCLLSVACSSDDKESSPTKKALLKVMSFNILNSNVLETYTEENHWEARREPCVTMIRDVAPDVIGFQEPYAAQREYLQDQLTEYATWNVPESETVAENQTGYTMIMYLRSKYTLIRSGYFWLSATPEEPSRPWDAQDQAYRTTVWVHLKDNATQKEFYFFTTHLPYVTTDKVQRLQACQLNVSKMKEIAGRVVPIFLVGDMNSSYAESDSRRACLEPYYEWMWSGRDTAPNTDTELSYNNFDVSSQKETWNLDHIFYRLVAPIQFRTVTSREYGVTYLSDHFPIVLTCEF